VLSAKNLYCCTFFNLVFGSCLFIQIHVYYDSSGQMTLKGIKTVCTLYLINQTFIIDL